MINQVWGIAKGMLDENARKRTSLYTKKDTHKVRIEVTLLRVPRPLRLSLGPRGASSSLVLPPRQQLRGGCRAMPQNPGLLASSIGVRRSAHAGLCRA